LLLVKIHVPQEAKIGDAARIEGMVDWLECEQTCIPGSAKVDISIPIGPQAQNAKPDILALFEKYRNQIPPDDYDPRKETTSPQPVGNEKKDPAGSSLPIPRSEVHGPKLNFLQALFGAFVGGIILNLMPCVLPVIAIKILGFVKQGNSNPQQVRLLGNLFSLGVLVSFWFLAMLVIVLRTAGQSVGWGFQFQDVRFVLIMALVVIAVALNFFGIFEFELQGSALNQAGDLASRDGKAGAFFNGVLATTLATPCTAPFLAPALGFAFSQSAVSIFLIFTVVGIGLAFPYLILSWQPALLKWLPKPGTWMVRFKQSMGFVMLATALWLAWIVGSAYGNQAAIATLGWLLLSAFAIWFVSAVTSGRMIGILAAVLVMSIVGFGKVAPMVLESHKEMNNTAESLVRWKPFSKSALDDALKTDQIVFIDFTADWCLTCQVNKRTSIEIPSVASRFKELNAIAFLADWTRSDPEITEMLKSFGRSGVPVYVVYPKDRTKPPIILSELLTPQTVLDALNEAEK
jgi:thiol:disulfide interchange protein